MKSILIIAAAGLTACGPGSFFNQWSESAGCIDEPQEGSFCPNSGIAQGQIGGQCSDTGTCAGDPNDVVCADNVCELCGGPNGPCCNVGDANDEDGGNCPSAPGIACNYTFVFPLCVPDTDCSGDGAGDCDGSGSGGSGSGSGGTGTCAGPIIDGSDCLSTMPGAGVTKFYFDVVSPVAMCARAVHNVTTDTLAHAQAAANHVFASVGAIGPISQNEPDAEPQAVLICPSGDMGCDGSVPTTFYATASSQYAACEASFSTSCNWQPQSPGTTMCPPGM
ncbi:MAG TPA: hypothetical protein VGM88_33400 [Kofleriaceae bacterium]|jgi:hypothetical protein